MAGVVKSMDATLKSMNLEKVNRLTFVGGAHQKQKGPRTHVLRSEIHIKRRGFAVGLVDPGIGCPVWL